MTSIQLITKSCASILPEKAQYVNDLRRHLIDVWLGVSVIDDVIYSGAIVSIPAFEPKEDILNIHRDIRYAKHY